MNLFATSPCPKQSAIWLDDKRVNKMLTESAQILCTVLHADGIKNLPFKPTHQSHPVVRWSGDTDANLYWVAQHHTFLFGEWVHRFGKSHASGLSPAVLSHIRNTKSPQTFQNSAKNDSRGLDFTWCDDVHKAYQMYMTARWVNDTLKPKWTKRCIPNWCFDAGDSGYFDLCKRAADLIIKQKIDGEVACPRCGENLKYQGHKKTLIRLECPTPNCLVWQII